MVSRDDKNCKGRPQALRIEVRRLMHLEERLAYDFVYHTQRMLTRLGLTDGWVKAKRHNGKLVKVRFQVGGSGHRGGEHTPGAKGRRSYSPEDSQAALESRLARVTQGCNIRFGRIFVAVAAGDIIKVDFTDSIRPWKERFGRYFGS